ncbi:MAG: GNAT family N-acetyltransferase [Clostridiaceae bacterium]
MIRKLATDDIIKIKSYLNKNPSFSLFLIADIDKYGFNTDIFTIYADFDNSENINFIFGKYFDTLLIYSNKNYIDIEVIYSYLNDHSINFNVLIISNDFFEASINDAEFTHIHRTYCCELTKENFKPVDNTVPISIASEDDSSKILSLFNSIEEFEGLDMTEEAIKNYIKDNNVYIIKEGNEIASFTMCTATTEVLASIGAVCTGKKHRGKGHASALVSHLSNTILNKGLKCSLCYDNPEAGTIYKRLGFKEVGHTIIAIK